MPLHSSMCDRTRLCLIKERRKKKERKIERRKERNKERISPLIVPIQHHTTILAKAIRQENKIKGIQIGKEH